jgi:LCP family protein required for cell wall assembly
MIYVPSKQAPPAPRAARSAHAIKRGTRRPWYARRSVQLPLLFVVVMLATIGFCWWHLPVVNPLTGENETNGTRFGRTMRNIVQPKLSLKNSFNGQRQVSVLMVGLDHVPATKRDPGVIRRSDSVLLATTDFDTKQIRILSIPRDGWVQHYRDGEAHGWEKLGHSYAFGQQANPDDPLGGIKCTQETVEHLIGLPVDFYAVIQFDGLVKLVDMLGGLDVDVEKDMKYTDRAGGLFIDLKKGPQHLTGEQVVQYARFRHDALSDIARMGRQQKVIKLILVELRKPEHLAQLPQLTQLFEESVLTNLSLDQLLAIVQHLDEYDATGIETLTLPSFNNREPGHFIDLPHAYRGLNAQYINPDDAVAGREFLLNLTPPPPPPPAPTEEGAAGAEGSAGDGEAADSGADG